MNNIQHRWTYLLIASVMLSVGELQSAEPQLRIESLSTYQELTHASGEYGRVGLKQKVFPPEGKQFLRMRGRLEYSPKENFDELPGPSKEEIFLADSEGNQHHYLFGMEGPGSLFQFPGYLTFGIKSDRLFDLVFLVPKTYEGGVFHYGPWKTTLGKPEENMPLDPRDMATFKVVKATTGQQIDLPEEVVAEMKPEDRQLPRLVEGNTFLRVEVEINAKLESSVWLKRFYYGMGNAVLVTDRKTLHLAIAREPIRNFIKRFGSSGIRKGEADVAVLYFMVPKTTEKFVLGFRGVPVAQGEIRGTFKGAGPKVEAKTTEALKFEVLETQWREKIEVTRRPHERKLELKTEVAPISGTMLLVSVSASGLKSHGQKISSESLSCRFSNGLVAQCAGLGFRDKHDPIDSFYDRFDKPLEQILYFVVPRKAAVPFELLLDGQPIASGKTTVE